jgi:GNAT superfamily N-acetyltransferase
MTMIRIMRGSAYFDQADALFQRSFEYKERAKDLNEAHEEGTLTLALVQDELVVCFANYRDYGKFVYVEHIATLESMRGRKIASALFKYFMEHWDFFIVEVNLESTIVPTYERMGFVVNPYDYVVPPYGGNPNSERYLLMSYPTMLSREQFDEMTSTLFKDAYLREVKK